MTDKRTITINGFYLKLILITFLSSFLIIYLTQHFGKFSYTYNRTVTSEKPSGIEGVRIQTTEWNADDPVTSIHFKTPFGLIVDFPANGWKIEHMETKYGDFYDYSNKFKYYLQATIKEFPYVLGLWILLFVIYLFFKKFNIKLT